jgi:hypothetical protein
MIIPLKFVDNYLTLSLEESFQGIYFGHAFSKAYQYDTIIKEKV